MKNLFIICCVLFFYAQCISQTDLATSQLIISSQDHKNVSTESSVDFRNMENRSFPISNSPEWMNPGGPITTNLKINLVTDHRKLDQEIDGTNTLSATAKYLSYSGTATFNEVFENDYHTDEKTISIVIKLETNYGLYGYKDPLLKDAYQELLNDGNHTSFVERCGTHFVQQSERIVRAVAVININNVDESTKRFLSKKYSAKISGNFSGVQASAEGSSHLQRLINTSKSMTNIDVNFSAIGAGGAPALESLVKNINKTDVNDVMSALSEFVKTGTKENSAPSKYYLASYKRFGMELGETYNYNEQRLTELYAGLFRINSDIKRLSEIQSLRPEYQSYYIEILDQRKKQSVIFKELINSCLKNSMCSVDPPEIPVVYWPENWIKEPTLILSPHYSALNHSTDGHRDQILDNITVRIEGYLLFPEYFNRFEFGYFDKKSSQTIIENFVAGDRVIFDQISNYGDINSKYFLAQLDTKNVRHNTSGGYALNNQSNQNNAINLIKTIGEREYFIKSYDTEGREFTTYLGRVNTSQISSIIR